MSNRLTIWLISLVVLLTACAPRPAISNGEALPTATLAPVLSQTPRLTATPVPTRTPIPTITPIPPTPTLTYTPSDTPTPTPIPPVIGRVNSLQRVNVRSGPGIEFDDFEALDPGTEVEVIGQSSDGRWLNVKLESGAEGWMSSRLLLLQPTPTGFPTFTPTTDETAIAQGTIYPTALLGGGSVTPTATLPGALAALLASPQPPDGTEADDTTPLPSRTPTPTPTRFRASIDDTPVVSTWTPTPTITPTSPLVVDESVLPVVIDIDALNATATALSRNIVLPTASNTPDRGNRNLIVTPDGASNPLTILTPDDLPEISTTGTARPAAANLTPTGTVDPDAEFESLVTPRAVAESVDLTDNPAAEIRNGVDVLAYCDDPAFNAPAPTNLKAGSTIDIYWIWYASQQQYLDQHLANVTYDIFINDNRLTNLDRYRLQPQQIGDDLALYWFVPAGPLAAGEYTITYRVSWRDRIFDGYDFYGPGSLYPVEQGSCTFVVYE